MGGYLSTGNVQPVEQKKETESQTVLNSTDTQNVSTEPVTNTTTVITEAGVEAAMENNKESVKTSDIPATPNSTPVLRAAEPTGPEVFERHVEKSANKVEIAPVMVSASDDIVKKPNKKKNKNKKAKQEQ
jgi:hypothetical protein